MKESHYEFLHQIQHPIENDQGSVVIHAADEGSPDEDCLKEHWDQLLVAHRTVCKTHATDQELHLLRIYQRFAE